MKGRAGENLLLLLESRLDNVVYRLGFATSRNEARQLVRHGHFTINGKKVKTPSIQVRPGWSIGVREKSRQVNRITAAIEALEESSLPQWLEIDKDKSEVTVKQLPVRQDITLPIEEQLIVELYSR
jgi:small subunit ribosomal protein S4